MPRRATGNPFRILGKSQSLGWRTHVAFAFPALFAAIFFDLSRVTGSVISWLGLASIGYLVTVTAIYIGSKLLDQRNWQQPRPFLATGILLMAGLARGATIYLVGVPLGIISPEDWVFRLLGAPVYVFATYFLLNWIVDEFIEYSREFQRLQSEQERLAKASTDFEEQIASLQELQRASIRELLSPAIWELQKLLESAKSQSDLRQAIFELRSINERLVRPLSRALTADSLTEDVLGLQRPTGQRVNYRLPSRIVFSGTIGVEFFLLTSAAISFSAMVTLFGPLDGSLILGIATLVSWALLRVADRFLQMQVPTQLGFIISVVLGFLIGITAGSVIALTGLSDLMPFLMQAIIFYTLALPLAFVLGVFRYQRAITLQDLNATLEQQNS